jgi:hypothetical protein
MPNKLVNNPLQKSYTIFCPHFQYIKSVDINVGGLSNCWSSDVIHHSWEKQVTNDKKNDEKITKNMICGNKKCASCKIHNFSRKKVIYDGLNQSMDMSSPLLMTPVIHLGMEPVRAARYTLLSSWQPRRPQSALAAQAVGHSSCWVSVFLAGPKLNNSFFIGLGWYSISTRHLVKKSLTL